MAKRFGRQKGAVRRTQTCLSLPIKCGDLCIRKSLPFDKCGFALSLKVLSWDEIPFVVEVIANCGMCGDKFLKGLLSAKALHWILSSSKGRWKFSLRWQCQSKLAWAEWGRSVASLDEKSIPLFQQFTRSDPPDGDDVRPISLIAAPGRGPAVRAWHRHLSWDGAVLLEQVRSVVRRRDPEAASS